MLMVSITLPQLPSKYLDNSVTLDHTAGICCNASKICPLFLD